MQLFTLKKHYELAWDDIPFIENPTFGDTHTMNAIRSGDKIWERVTNIKEFIAAEIGHFNPFCNNRQTELKVYDLFHQGTYFSVAHHKPFAPAFTWKPDSQQPDQGEWVMQNPWVYPPFVVERIKRITAQRKRMLAEAYLSELQATPYAIAQAAVEEQVNIPMAKVSSAIAAPSIASAQPELIAAEKPAPTYRVLKGKYGTLHDYGDHIVHWDIDNVIGRSDILSKPAYTTRHCYALGEGFGLPITDDIAPGKPLLNFGGDIPHGTIFATFVPDGKGNMVYPNSRNKVNNSPHLFVYDAKSGGLTEINGKQNVNVIEQWASLPAASRNRIGSSDTDSYRLYKHMDKYYAVTIKKQE